MKKTIAWILVLTLFITSLSACGGTPASMGNPLDFVEEYLEDYLEEYVGYGSVGCFYVDDDSKKEVWLFVSAYSIWPERFGSFADDAVTATKKALSLAKLKLESLEIEGSSSTYNTKISWETENYRNGILEHTLSNGENPKDIPTGEYSLRQIKKLYSDDNEDMFKAMLEEVPSTEKATVAEKTTRSPEYLAEKEEKEAELEEIEKEIKKLGLSRVLSVKARTYLFQNLKSTSLSLVFTQSIQQQITGSFDEQQLLDIIESSKSLLTEKGYVLEDISITCYFKESNYKAIFWDSDDGNNGTASIIDSENTSYHKHNADRQEVYTLDELIKFVFENAKHFNEDDEFTSN